MEIITPNDILFLDRLGMSKLCSVLNAVPYFIKQLRPVIWKYLKHSMTFEYITKAWGNSGSNTVENSRGANALKRQIFCVVLN